MGWLHHQHYLKHQERGVISHLHMWFGRLLLIAGIVNGGLGLQLAGAMDSLVIAYSTVAGVMVVLYAVTKIFVSMRSKHQGRRGRGTKEVASPRTPPNHGAYDA
jgi:hypothetical protein